MSKKYDKIMKNITVTPEMKERILQKIKDEKENSEDETHSTREKAKIIKFNQYKRQLVTVACLVVAVLTAIIVPNFYTNNDVTENLPTLGENTKPSLSTDETMDNLEESTKDLPDLPIMSGDDLAQPTSFSETPSDSLNDSNITNPSVTKPTTPATNIPETTEEVTEEPSNTTVSPVNPLIEYETAEELEQAVGFEIDELLNLSILGDSSKFLMVEGIAAEIIYKQGDSYTTVRKLVENSGEFIDYNEYDIEKVIQVDGVDVKMKGEEEGYLVVEWCNSIYFYSINIDNKNDSNALYLSEKDVIELVESINV